MNKRRWPDWALPRLDTVGLDYRKVRGVLGSQGRVRNLTAEDLRKIGQKGYDAYMGKMTPEERSERARHAAIIGNAKRWAGHVKKQRSTKPRGWNAAEAGRKGNEARWGSKPT